MNATGPALKDIHVPPAAWWPPAPGWWIVAAVVLLIACATAWLLWRRSRRGVARAALREVEALARAYAQDHDAGHLAEGASRLLRRVALVVDPAAASHSGDAWRAFVDRHASDPTTRNALEQLLDVRFRAQPSVDAAALLAALRAWCGDALRRPPRQRRDAPDSPVPIRGQQDMGEESVRPESQDAWPASR